jgi:hypothetical protein
VHTLHFVYCKIASTLGRDEPQDSLRIVIGIALNLDYNILKEKGYVDCTSTQSDNTKS